MMEKVTVPLLAVMLLGLALQGEAYAQMSPANTPDELGQVIQAYGQGDKAKATEALKSTVKREPENADAWYNLGLLLRPTPDMHGARKAFENAIKLRPDFAAAHGALAEHLFTIFHRLPEARASAERALALEPTNHLAHYTLGAIRLSEGAPHEALESANSALKGKPQYLPALKLKANALLDYYAAGAAPGESLASRHWMLREAAQTLEEYLRIDPKEFRRTEWEMRIKVIRTFLDAVGAAEEVGGGRGEVYGASDVSNKAVIFLRPEPEYPRRLLEAGKLKTGRAMVRAVLDADGSVKNVEFIESTISEMREPVLTAVRGIRFVPALKDGRPASVRVALEYVWTFE